MDQRDYLSDNSRDGSKIRRLADVGKSVDTCPTTLAQEAAMGGWTKWTMPVGGMPSPLDTFGLRGAEDIDDTDAIEGDGTMTPDRLKDLS